MLQSCSLVIKTKKQRETDFHFYEIKMSILFSEQNDSYAKTWKRCRSMYVWSYVERYFHQRPEKQLLNLWNYSNYDTSGLTLDSFDGTDRYWLSSIIQIIQYYNFLFYYLFFLSICSLQKQANMSSKTTKQFYSCCKSPPVRKDEFHFVCHYFLIVGDVVVEHAAVWWLSLTVAALVFVGHLPQTQR